MNHLLTKWHSEDDPLTREQVAVLRDLLDGQLTEKALEGFLIVCSRFVDEFGNHRTQELANIFRTSQPEGKMSLLKSLEYGKNKIKARFIASRHYMRYGTASHVDLFSKCRCAEVVMIHDLLQSFCKLF